MKEVNTIEHKLTSYKCQRKGCYGEYKLEVDQWTCPDCGLTVIPEPMEEQPERKYVKRKK